MLTCRSGTLGTGNYDTRNSERVTSSRGSCPIRPAPTSPPPPHPPYSTPLESFAGGYPMSVVREKSRRLLLAVFLATAARLPAQTGNPIPRSTPEREGISSSAILAFVNAADSLIDAMNSVMIVRHGHVVAEGWWAPYDARTPHVL